MSDYRLLAAEATEYRTHSRKLLRRDPQTWASPVCYRHDGFRPIAIMKGYHHAKLPSGRIQDEQMTNLPLPLPLPHERRRRGKWPGAVAPRRRGRRECRPRRGGEAEEELRPVDADGDGAAAALRALVRVGPRPAAAATLAGHATATRREALIVAGSGGHLCRYPCPRRAGEAVAWCGVEARRSRRPARVEGEEEEPAASACGAGEEEQAQPMGEVAAEMGGEEEPAARAVARRTSRRGAWRRRSCRGARTSPWYGERHRQGRGQATGAGAGRLGAAGGGRPGASGGRR